MISLFKTLRSRIARSTRLLGQLQTLGLPSCPVAFLGISEHIKQESLAPPIGATTLFRLGVNAQAEESGSADRRCEGLLLDMFRDAQKGHGTGRQAERLQLAQ